MGLWTSQNCGAYAFLGIIVICSIGLTCQFEFRNVKRSDVYKFGERCHTSLQVLTKLIKKMTIGKYSI